MNKVRTLFTPLLFFSFGLFAQGIDTSIHVYFTQIYDANYPNDCQIVPNVFSTNHSAQFLYYTALYSKGGISQKDALDRQTGLLALLPNDTSTVYLTFNPIPKDSGDRVVQFFISENEFVIAQAIWSSKSTAMSNSPTIQKNIVGLEQKKVPQKDLPKPTPIGDLNKSSSDRTVVYKPSSPPPTKSPQPVASSSVPPSSSSSNQKPLPVSVERVVPDNKQAKQLIATDDFQISGLMINETRTRLGAEFFRKLQEIWTPPESAGSYWITVRELPSPGTSSILSVQLNNRELFQRNLFPKAGYVESLAYQTANLLTSVLKDGNYDGSLQNDDLFGSGVE